MFKILFVLFIVVPLLELYVLIEVGSMIGALPTILLTIATAAIGGLLMKHQGLRVVQQAQMTMAQGQAPQQQVIEGMLIFVGGAMLLLPGLVTDFLGFLLLLPPIRTSLAKRWLAKRTQQAGAFQSHVHAEWTVRDPDSGRIEHYQASRRYKSSAPENDVIEGEVLESDDKNAKKP